MDNHLGLTKYTLIGLDFPSSRLVDSALLVNLLGRLLLRILLQEFALTGRRELSNWKKVLLLYIYLLFFLCSFGTRWDRSPVVDLRLRMDILGGKLVCRRYSVVKGDFGVDPRNQLFLLVQNQVVQIICLIVVYFWCGRSVSLSLLFGNGLCDALLENWF